jgi:hypothetical protein
MRDSCGSFRRVIRNINHQSQRSDSINVSFVTTEPRGDVRPLLDDVLESGRDRIMIASAFCTNIGVKVIRRHLTRLKLPGSCLVVSAEFPTNTHSGGKLPKEISGGDWLMHSKVYYAENGATCQMLVGSHNLTGYAIEGVNFEAGLLIAGHPAEQPFVDARRHIEACRNESSLCPLEIPLFFDGDVVDMVAIHAEADRLPDYRETWYARLGLRNAIYDWMLTQNTETRLHLYHPGALENGWQNARPWCSYRGTLTGINYTQIHPETPGIPASWSERHPRITEEGTILKFTNGSAPVGDVVTQAIIKIDEPVSSDETLLSERPKLKADPQTERRLLRPVDPDLAPFFTRKSIVNGQLVAEVERRSTPRWELPLEDLRNNERRQLNNLTNSEELGMKNFNRLDSRRVRHPMIQRVKYRLNLEPKVE